MLMECRVPQSSTPDVCDIYSCDIPDDTTGWRMTTTSSTPTVSTTSTKPTRRSTTTTPTTITTTTADEINDECTFIESDDGAVFDTGEPYANKMRIEIYIQDTFSCTFNFTCKCICIFIVKIVISL